MDFEKLGAFYLGKEYDLAAGRLLDRLVMYDARDLTTHAVCIGMTGSGKTGLCLSLLEEAAIDRVPAIIIDPKGDITNLLLAFPDLSPDDFRPWINLDDARRKNLSPDDFAAQEAAKWRQGLGEWGQDGNRIRMLKEAADFAIYTPGSQSGIPISILKSFAAPALDWAADAELLRERIQGTVGALLGLIGVDVDPVKSREQILISTLFEHFWRQGRDLDLPQLISAIQKPPLRQLGVFDVDTFFPEKDRFNLAMSLNNIIAAPGFQSWLSGQPLDIPGFLATPDGKPRQAIFYIAHLSDAERMFFVTMLLNQVVSWMRGQPGTTSLRALLYMDEIFGFFPPVANPPSKRPMLTLLKQARAFGLGVVLTTQNPVDLDYKGLANAGTWFIGRLQTERDKLRVLEGLESASAQAGGQVRRDELDRRLSSLGSRVFLLHNVHAEKALIFQTRWAMSYLRGPLTRDQVKILMAGRSPEGEVAPPRAQGPAGTAAQVPSPPALPPDIRQVHLPTRLDEAAAGEKIGQREGGSVEVKSAGLVYIPAVLGLGRVHYLDRRLKVDQSEEFCLLAQLPGKAGRIRWDSAEAIAVGQKELSGGPRPGASFQELPEADNRARDYKAFSDDLAEELYRSRTLSLFYNPSLKSYSQPGESQRDFSLRLSQAAREERDSEVDKVEARYATRLRTIEDRLRRTEAAAAKRESDAQVRKTEMIVSVGESILGMFMGRRTTRAASTAMSKYRMSRSAGMGAQEAAQSAETLKQELAALEAELKRETEAIGTRWEEALAKVETVMVAPRRGDVEVDLVALTWTPHWRLAYRDRGGAERTGLMPAYY